jgi:hypothetical protein
VAAAVPAEREAAPVARPGPVLAVVKAASAHQPSGAEQPLVVVRPPERLVAGHRPAQSAVEHRQTMPPQIVQRRLPDRSLP